MKKEMYLKEVELCIKQEDFSMAEKAFHKSLSYGSETERKETEDFYYELFRIRAGVLENSGKTRKAIEVYERLFSITKIIAKKEETRSKLIALHDSLGHMREADRFKRLQF